MKIFTVDFESIDTVSISFWELLRSRSISSSLFDLSSVTLPVRIPGWPGWAFSEDLSDIEPDRDEVAEDVNCGLRSSVWFSVVVSSIDVWFSVVVSSIDVWFAF
jgi:hypothetical protein